MPLRSAMNERAHRTAPPRRWPLHSFVDLCGRVYERERSVIYFIVLCFSYYCNVDEALPLFLARATNARGPELGAPSGIDGAEHHRGTHGAGPVQQLHSPRSCSPHGMA